MNRHKHDFLKTFFDRNPNFDLLRFDFSQRDAVGKLDFGGGEPEATVDTLKAFQRLLRVHPSHDVAAALDEAGLRSAHDIVGMSEHMFVRRYAGLLDGRDGKTAGAELARGVHRRAADIVERVRLHAMSLVKLADPPMPANNSSGLLNFYSGLPGYQELFGSLNYLQCEECQSIWSPAAYFVDLLRLVDAHITEPEDKRLALAARRPDLWRIPLTCESTNQEVPYLQIVNQILEAQVQARLKRPLLNGLQPAGARHTLKFDGSTTYISLNQNPFLVPDYNNSPTTYAAPKEFTICAWVNPALLNPSAGVLPIAGWVNNNAAQAKPALYMDENSTDLVAALQAESPDDVTFTHTSEHFFSKANTWVHVAWVFDLTGKHSTVYRNGIQFGVPVSTGNISAIYSDPGSAYYIGNAYSKVWEGVIANVGIWLRALEPREILSVMKSEGLPESRSAMSSYWMIDDDSTTIENSAPYAIANTTLEGTLDGTAQWETLSLSSAGTFLSANPVLSEQPLLYLATQDYPFKLPFNHPLVQIRRLLAHFDTTLAELYAAFLVGNATGDKPDSIAREVLELSPEKYNLLTEQMTETPALQQAYGLIAEGAELSELSDSGVFLEQTGLSDDQLHDLLYQNLRRKRALEFDGSLEVSIGNPPALQALTGDLTVEMWLRPTDLTERRNPLCKAFAGEFAVTQNTASGSEQANIQFYYGEAGESGTGLYQSFAIEPSFLNLNQWSHVAIVRDLSNTKTLYAYVNGQPAGSGPATYPVAVAGESPVLIGAGYVSPYMGQIADVRIWNTARTKDEIKAGMSRRLRGDEPGLSGCWPLDDDVGTTARDLSRNKNYGSVGPVSGSLTQPPAWPLADNLVWDDNEINAQILGQFFINQGLGSGQYLSVEAIVNASGEVERAIVVTDPANGTAAPLNDAGTFDRLNRFIRLARSLEWSFAQLDLALRSVQPPPATEINDQTIKALAAMKRLQARLGLQVDSLCALWSNMNTFGIGEGAVAEDLFDRTFNYPTSFADPTGSAGAPPYRPSYSPDPLYNDPVINWTPNGRGSQQDNSIRGRLRGSLGLDDDDLSLLSDSILESQQESAPSIELNVENLSKFYRYTTLARALGLPMGQFLTLLRLLNVAEVDSVEKVGEVVDWSDWMRSAGLNVAQLEYLTTGKPNPWINPGYDTGAVASLLESMFEESQSLLLTPSSFMSSGISQGDAEQIFQQLQSDGSLDANGVVLKQPVEQAFGPEPLSRYVLYFNGSSTCISIPNDPFIRAGGGPAAQFTICVWARPGIRDESSYHYICGMEDDGDADKVKPAMYMSSEGRLVLWAGGFDASGDPTHFAQALDNFFPTWNAWVQIAWVVDLQTSTWTVYRNGEMFWASSQTGLKQLYTSDTGYTIGRLTGNDMGEVWQGEVANFGVWQRLLDQREIVSVMYASGLPAAGAGLTAYWSIDDQSQTGGIIKDSAGDNDGTLNGAAAWDTARDVLGQEGSSNLLNLFVRETLGVALARQDLYVTQKLAAFFSVSQGVMAAAQALALASHGEALLHINRLLIDLQPGDTVPDQADELIAVLALDLYLAAALSLTAGDLGGIARQPVAFGLAEYGPSFQWTIKNIRAISVYRGLAAAFNCTAGEMVDYFNLASNAGPGFSEAARAKLSAITGWPLDQIALLEAQEFWPPECAFDTVEQVAALKRCFDLANVLGAGIDLTLTLRGLNSFELGAPGAGPSVETWESYQAVAHDLSQVVVARYGNSVAPQVMSTIEGQLEQLKRDALVAFLLWELSFTYDDIKTSDDLYDFLLIDVDMSSAVQISRLKAGLNSLQLYVESTRMNLEAEAVNRIPPLWWRWMSNYRVWQANREVFLYPENYIDPALRKFKTPPFKQLEASLQQGSLTPQLVESSLTGYLEAFAGVANLEIVASYRARVKTPESEAGTSPGIDTLFLFGRTRTNPATFYYRTLRLFNGGDIQQGVWTPWQQINLSINAERVTPAYAFEKLFIFWVEQNSKTVNVSNGSHQGSYQITTASIYFSFQKLDRNWTQQQTLEQNLPISVSGPYTYYHVDLSSQVWRQVQPFTDPVAGQIIILYGPLILDRPTSVSAPSKVGNPEIDGYNQMVYESLLFAQSLGQVYFLNSLIPLWTLGETMERDRANLKTYPLAFNYCVGTMLPDSRLAYAEISSVIFDDYSHPVLQKLWSMKEDVAGEVGGQEGAARSTLPLGILYLLGGVSAFARVELVGNQPGWFTFDNGNEAFLVAPVIPATTSDPASGDVFRSLDQMAIITEAPPTGSGRGVDRRAITIVFKDAAADRSTFNFADLKLKFIRLTTHTVPELERRFFIGGADMLLDLASQLTPELPFLRLKPTAQVIAPSTSLLDFNGAYGEYFWELFFYTPFLIANTSSAGQRFQMAQKWFQYIFNPTRVADDTGLVGYWPLDGNADDKVGHNDGQLIVSVEPFFIPTTFADGSERQVLSSPVYKNNDIQVPGAASLNLTQAITLEAWCYFYHLGTDDSWLIQKKVDGGFDNPWYVYRLSVKVGIFTFSLSINGAYVHVSGELEAKINEWYYVAGTFDGAELRLYVNGKKVGGQRLAALSSSVPPPWAIATSGKPVVFGGDTFYGELAEVRIWNKALPHETVMAHYIRPQPEDRFWQFRPFLNRSLDSLKSNLTNPQQLAVYAYDPFDPDAVARLRTGANEKGIVMRYVENLMKWGNSLFAQYTWESITEATVLYTESLELLGPAPRQVGDIPAPPVKTALDFVKEYGSAAQVPPFLIELEHGVEFTPPASGQYLPLLPFNLLNSYFCVPMNKLLLTLRREVDNQLYKIRHGENIKGQSQPLPLFEPPLNPNSLVRASAGGLAASTRPPSGSPSIPYYRFSYLIGQAKDFTSQVIQLGSSLLGALERQDAEQLALIQNGDEATILNLTTQIKQNQIDGLEQTGQSLQAALIAAQQRQQTYAAWLQGKSGSGNGQTSGQQSSSVSTSWGDSLSKSESISLGMLEAAAILHSEAALMRLMAMPLYLLPDIFGLADGGMNYGGSIEAMAGSLDSVGGASGVMSQLAGMVGEFQRRDEEWALQYQLASDDVYQIQAQIEANQTALSSAQRDLQINQEQITQNQAIGNFYRTKFTSEQLYQWMAGQLSTAYFQSYQLAFDLAQEAQMALQYEKNSQKNYLNYGAWDSVEKGLTAGDSLMLSLNQMEKGYLDAGIRHLEIEKTVSLLQVDPQAVIALKTTGTCSFALTERLFDHDFPGHYNRKISAVLITIPAIVGPYQNIHATLRQTSSRVVLQPDIDAVSYLLTGGERNAPPPLTIRSNWNVNQQVALSRGTDDSGLFVLDFNDPRYLPFEGTGAVSTWTLSMPQAANPINFGSISDIIIKLSYTAQDGGDEFRSSVINQPGIQNYSGYRFISLRQTFPEAWYNFLHPTSGSPELQFPISRAMFPLNLEPDSVTLGTRAEIQTKLKGVSPGTISVQWVVAEVYGGSLPALSLNGQGVTENLVQLVAPGQQPTGGPVPLSDFGISEPNTLSANAPIPREVSDVVIIIPFGGQLRWS